jgi:hypothetical protein
MGAIAFMVRGNAFPREDVWLVTLPLGIMGSCYLFPRMFVSWYSNQYWQGFQWIWGDVRCELNCDALNWMANRNKLLLPWDSLSEILLCGDCLWFSCNTPWLIRLPIHRDWVDRSDWEKLLLAARAHTRFYDIAESFRLRPGYTALSQIALQQHYPVPQSHVAAEGQIAFRTPSSRDQYPSAAFKKTLTFVCFAPLVVLAVLCVAAQLHWLEVPGSKTLVQVMARLSILPALIGFLPQLPPIIIQRLAFGSVFFGQTQTFVNAQSGLVSGEYSKLESPLSVMDIHAESMEKVDVNEIDVIIHLSKKHGKSLVIPLEQFSDSEREIAIAVVQAFRHN